ncbi:MAG: flagellar motor protein MotD [Sinobacteraceae bacterium]|nr:flagellar motor protein MotD [Nevskiaceae bacterium]
MRHYVARRRRKPEEHTSHEAWAIPYGDLLTLLLAFFVVMYAISSVNAGKYRVVSDSLFAAFHGEPRSMQAVQVGAQPAPGNPDHRIQTDKPPLNPQGATRLDAAPIELALQKTSGGDALSGPLPPQAAAAAAALSHLADQIEGAMSDLVKKNLVTIRRTDFWIEVEMRTDILFPSGSARLADSAGDVIQKLGSVLAPFPNPIRVEGHTDNKPIRTALFYSNWELSAARAASVVRVLSDHGVGPARLAVVGYGDQRPLKTNDTPQGRDANRRVVVVILSTELMRQPDPAQLPQPADNAAAPAAPEAVPATTQVAAPAVAPLSAAPPDTAPPSAASPTAAFVAALPAPSADQVGTDSAP